MKKDSKFLFVFVRTEKIASVQLALFITETTGQLGFHWGQLIFTAGAGKSKDDMKCEKSLCPDPEAHGFCRVLISGPQ